MADQVKGKSIVLLINVSGTLTPYACGRGISINETTDFIETSVSGSGKYATVLPTKNSWDASIDGIVAFNDGSNLTLAGLKALQFSQSLLAISIVTSNDGATTDLTETGTAYISSCSYSGSFDDMATFSISLKGSGELTKVFTP